MTYMFPSGCGEGCDACPPPNDCPLNNDLSDCLSDRMRPLEQRALAAEQKCGELEREVERVRKYLNAFLHPTAFDCRGYATAEEHALRHEAREYMDALQPNGEAPDAGTNS